MIKQELQHQKDMERIKAFRLMDDDFMTAVFDNAPAEITEVLQIILERNDLSVQSVTAQKELKNLHGHSVRLDVYAKDSNDTYYDIEIQRADHGAGARRARYNLGMMDAFHLPTSTDHSKLPETYVIFITENDVFHEGLPLYHIERIVMETNKRFNDGEHIIYVNGAYTADDPIGRLMADFRETDPNNMYSNKLADRVRHFKQSEEGIRYMCRMMEDMKNEVREEIILKLLEKYPPEKVADMLELPFEMVNGIRQNHS